ncbi:MAG: hypothetical protein KJ893_03960 [Candidatus Omnitrophica bacterium]|nr:hypothetical protein [Candidatus Omnitrophota bacterium]
MRYVQAGREPWHKEYMRQDAGFWRKTSRNFTVKAAQAKESRPRQYIAMILFAYFKDMIYNIFLKAGGKMRKAFIAVICTAMALGSGGSLFALTAESIKVYKDAKAENLEIVVVNHTRQPRVDYIKKIEVVIDKQEPVKKTFSFQRGSSQEFTVPITGIEEIQSVTVRAYPSSGISAEKIIGFQDIKPLE